MTAEESYKILIIAEEKNRKELDTIRQSKGKILIANNWDWEYIDKLAEEVYNEKWNRWFSRHIQTELRK